MENYDNWKLQTPDEPMYNECNFCGEICEETFCTKACKKAYEQEN